MSEFRLNQVRVNCNTTQHLALVECLLFRHMTGSLDLLHMPSVARSVNNDPCFITVIPVDYPLPPKLVTLPLTCFAELTTWCHSLICT